MTDDLDDLRSVSAAWKRVKRKERQQPVFCVPHGPVYREGWWKLAPMGSMVKSTEFNYPERWLA